MQDETYNSLDEHVQTWLHMILHDINGHCAPNAQLPNVLQKRDFHIWD